MTRKAALILVLPLMMAAAISCSKPEKPEGREKTLKEQAEAVGKFSDSVMTKGLEEKLPDIVEKAGERVKELDEAAGRETR